MNHPKYNVSNKIDKRILGECLLISSLPGKVSRTLVDIARLAGYCSESSLLAVIL